MPNPWLLLALVLFVGGVTYTAYSRGYTNGVTSENLKWTAATDDLKAKASNIMAGQEAKTLAVERANQALTEQMEDQNARHKTATDKAVSDAIAAARAAGGLRDPGVRPARCGSCSRHALPSTPTSTGVGTQGAPPGGVLSDEAQQFLFDFAKQADDTLSDLHTCRDHALAGNSP